MNKNKKSHTSEMLLEVWKMKEKIFNETQNMNCDQFFEYINQKTEETISYLKKHE